MKNYKLVITYDGTRYYGWEHQPDKDTIQGKLESVLLRLCETEVEVIGAGRTDAGVHAKGMVANVHMQTDLSETMIRDYMNRYLPEDIRIDEVTVASDRFHARYNATGKQYTYTCYCGDTKPVFERKYMTVLDFEPDMEAMKEAAKILEGEHDFRAFCANPNMKKTTVRNVDKIEIVRKRDVIYFNYHGEGFLQNMVRIMTGTLLEVGKGKLKSEDVKTILEGRDRKAAGYTAPARGLCLMKVEYD